MDKTPTTDNEWDRLLAEDALSGPEADRLWARLAPRVVESPSVWARCHAWLKRRWTWVSLPVMVTAAAVALLVVRTPAMDGLRERGVSTTPVLEATCGTATRPCTVGQPVYLRIAQVPQAGVLYLMLQDGTGARLLQGPVAVARGGQPLSIELIPEPADVAGGMRLGWCVRRESPGKAELEELLTKPAAWDGILQLRVEGKP